MRILVGTHGATRVQVEMAKYYGSTVEPDNIQNPAQRRGRFTNQAWTWATAGGPAVADIVHLGDGPASEAT